MDNSIVQKYLNASSEALKQEWDGLVRLALELPTEADGGGKAIHDGAVALAFASRCGTDSIKRKLFAIQHARACGLAPEEIMAQGQEVTVSAFNRSKRDSQLEKTVWLQWKVSGVMRELVLEEYRRICDILNFNTAEMFFQWMYAQLHDLTPAELKHAAGEAAPPAPKGKSQGKSDTGKGKSDKPPVTTQEMVDDHLKAQADDQEDAGPDHSDDDPE